MLFALLETSLALLCSCIPLCTLVSRQHCTNFILFLLANCLRASSELFHLRAEPRASCCRGVTLLARIAECLECGLVLLAKRLELWTILLVNRLDARLLRVREIQILHQLAFTVSAAKCAATHFLSGTHLPMTVATMPGGIRLGGNLCAGED